MRRLPTMSFVPGRNGSGLSTIAMSLTLLSFLFLMDSCKPKTEPGAMATGAVCGAPATWFPSSKTPRPNDAAFPDTSATNCDFHQWAWQEMLWLTQDVGGQMRFTRFFTDDDLFKDPTHEPMMMAAHHAEPMLHLHIRNAEPKDVTDDAHMSSIVQAGGGIMVDHNGRTLYYSVHFDSIMYDFIRANGYYDYEKYIKAPPATDYPVGSLEIKASWRIIQPGEKTDDIYTMRAIVNKVMYDADSNIVINPTSFDTVTVGLVGLHIVGIVAHHPEFIWATFEQIKNSPALSPTMSPTADSVVSPDNYVFYTGGTKANACNQTKTPTSLDVATQKLAPITQVMLLDAQGGGSPENVGNIDAINKSVHDQLEKGSMLMNYKLIGGLWLLPGVLVPGLVVQDSDLHGSKLLANSTMETFQQARGIFNEKGTGGKNCFFCHRSQESQTINNLPVPAMNMNLSHVVVDGLITREEKVLQMRAMMKSGKHSK